MFYVLTFAVLNITSSEKVYTMFGMFTDLRFSRNKEK